MLRKPNKAVLSGNTVKGRKVLYSLKYNDQPVVGECKNFEGATGLYTIALSTGDLKCTSEDLYFPLDLRELPKAPSSRQRGAGALLAMFYVKEFSFEQPQNPPR